MAGSHRSPMPPGGSASPRSPHTLRTSATARTSVLPMSRPSTAAAIRRRRPSSCGATARRISSTGTGRSHAWTRSTSARARRSSSCTRPTPASGASATDPTYHSPMQDAAGAIVALEHVTKRYGAPTTPPAVDDLTLIVPAGEICVLVGPSGCGKTTTMKMINRLIEPTIGGEDVMSLPAVQLRRRIGYVIQQVGLFPHLTVGDNVAVVPDLVGWTDQ